MPKATVATMTATSSRMNFSWLAVRTLLAMPAW
jgi:hypothetical protein